MAIGQANPKQPDDYKAGEFSRALVYSTQSLDDRVDGYNAYMGESLRSTINEWRTFLATLLPHRKG